MRDDWFEAEQMLYDNPRWKRPGETWAAWERRLEALDERAADAEAEEDNEVK